MDADTSAVTRFTQARSESLDWRDGVAAIPERETEAGLATAVVDDNTACRQPVEKRTVWMDGVRHALTCAGLVAIIGVTFLSVDSESRTRFAAHLLAADTRLELSGTDNATMSEAAVNVSGTEQTVAALVVSGTRASAAGSSDTALTREQQLAARWLSRKYRVALDAVEDIVIAAFDIGRKLTLDPYLILALISIESAFNPLAESAVGAQGLMQVMTRVHSDKFDEFGGKQAALHPTANIVVGARILKDYWLRTGSLEAALKFYVGAANLATDGGYGNKVLGERSRIVLAAKGKPVPINDAPPALSVKPETRDEVKPAQLSGPVGGLIHQPATASSGASGTSSYSGFSSGDSPAAKATSGRYANGASDARYLDLPEVRDVPIRETFSRDSI